MGALQHRHLPRQAFQLICKAGHLAETVLSASGDQVSTSGVS